LIDRAGTVKKEDRYVLYKIGKDDFLKIHGETAGSPSPR